MTLPKYGIQAVIEGLPAFNKGMDGINKKIADSTKMTQSASKNVDPLSSAFDKMGTSVDKVRDKLKGFIQDNVPFGKQLGGILDKLVAIPLPALAAAAAIVGLGAAFISLGERGASLVGLAQTFDNVTASVGVLSQQMLIDLRKASAGTISDFALIEKTNVALSGATGKLGEALGKNLPRLLEIARVQARATGKDIDFIFTSLVEGIRKSSPLRIDNAQLIIKVTAAEEAYAKSVGKSAEQLTVEEKGIAILNATLESGAAALAQAGDVQETNAEKISRANATITNTLDGLAIAVQPAFGIVLDATQKVLNIFQQLGAAVGPIFGGILSIVAGVFSTIVSVVTAVVQPIIDVFSSIAPYIALVFQFIAKSVNDAGKVIGNVVGGIVKFLSDVAKNFFGLDLKNLGPQLFNGAAAAFGSFANGILAVANKLIFPAVIGIAKFIADFLIGFSPPKEGPLSMIDKGGENIMKAWLGGITGVSLDPVEQVAAEVSAALGSIGKASLGSVNKRLALLDKALLPFQNRLDIIKSQFDALNEPAKAALDAIDRQTEALQEAVAQGDPKALERLRLLDAQRDAIQGQVDAQQALVDRAQVQLALAQAQQAPERTLLAIRKAYLDALARSKPKTAASSGSAPAAEKAPTGGAAPAPSSPTGAAPVSAGDMPSVLDLIGGQGAVDAAANGLSDAFMGAIDESGLQDFAQNSLDLGAQIDRIKSVDLGSKITDKFKGLTDAFNPDVEGSIANVVGKFFNGDGDTPGSLAFYFAHAGDALEAVRDTVGTKIHDVLAAIFDPEAEGTPMNTILTLVGQVTGDENLPGQVADYFSGLPDRISTAASGLLDKLKTDIFDPVFNFLTGNDEGTLGAIINQAVTLFSSLGPGIVGALQNFGGMVYNAIVVPIINVMNAGITAVESGIRNIATFFAGFLAQIIGSFDSTEVAGTNLGGLVPAALREFQAGLASVGSSFTIGRISTELPSFLQPLGGAKGGFFGPGLMKVGEKGPEYMFNATKMGVLPHQLVQVLGDLSSVLAQPQPMPMMAGNSYQQDSHNMSINMYGVQGGNDAIRRMAMLRARR